MPVISPSTSLRKRVPTSTAALSASDSFCGRAVDGHSEHGQPDDVGVRVVNVQLSSVAIALPAKSLTPVAPPLTRAVWTVPEASAAAGSSVAVEVAASYVTAAWTGVPAA